MGEIAIRWVKITPHLIAPTNGSSTADSPVKLRHLKSNEWNPPETMNNTPTNADLRQFINKHFDVTELNSFCFNYFGEVGEEFPPAMPKSPRIEMLIGYCQRRGLILNLLTALEKERSELYKRTFSATTVEPTTTSPSTIRNPRQIFISHAHQDATLAQRLATDLEAEGYPVWIAPDSILPGEKWAEAVNRGLDESGIFVLLLTPEAVDSRWVLHETNVAVELDHEDEMRLIPLQVKPCKLPALWRAYQRIAWRSGYEAGLAQLIQALMGNEQEPVLPAETSGARIEVVAERVLKPARQSNSFVHEKTGMEFVRIPAGDFLYGDDKKTLNLPEYWMSKTPVTQKIYKRFIDSNLAYDVPYRTEDWTQAYVWDKKKRTFSVNRADHPVVLVSWYDAVAFAEWADVQLATDQQWEKAARGADGNVYPWGNEWRENHCNTREMGLGKTSAVGNYSPYGDSPYGCVDMSGNVWEWCLNKYSNSENITVDKIGDYRVVRGGSWFDVQFNARAAFRYDFSPVNRSSYIGFRVVVRRPPSHVL